MNKLDSQSNSRAVDSLINYETVKYFNNEKMELDRYDDTLGEWEHWAVKSQNSMSILNFAQGAIIALGVTLVMYLAINAVVEGSMTIGDLVLVNAFLLQLFIPLSFLGVVYRQIKYSLADMDLVFKLLEREPEIVDADNAPDLTIRTGHVRFDHVNFSYNDDRQILKDISFDIHGGEKVAIVGHSGAGKSTLSRLMYRFYDINQGEIRIDGQNIAHVTQNSLRAAISIVPQDTILFNETIEYNLQYGNPDASREELIKAAKMAHILDFIESLPDGWHTMVGERGLKLSGGEKQRVAIARALLKKPKILVFDEATSSLDSQTEKAIQKTLAEVARNHTTLVIAHRLSTVVDANRILILDKGQLIEQGTHEQLITQGGLYSSMWELQQQEEAEATHS
jgi:ATP-binding cassette subfamily B protein